MPESVVHVQVRMRPALYERLRDWANRDGVSLNALLVGLLEARVVEREKGAGTEGAQDQG